MSRETGFSTRPERQKIPTTSENAARGKHGCITNDTGRNTGTNRLRGLSRVSAVCGKLRSIRARIRTGSYQLLADWSSNQPDKRKNPRETRHQKKTLQNIFYGTRRAHVN